MKVIIGLVLLLALLLIITAFSVPATVERLKASAG